MEQKPKLLFIDIEEEPMFDLPSVSAQLTDCFIAEQIIHNYRDCSATKNMVEKFKPDVIIFNLSTDENKKNQLLNVFVELKEIFPCIMPVFLHRQGHPKRDLIDKPPLEEFNLPIELFFTRDVTQIRKSTPDGFGDPVLAFPEEILYLTQNYHT